VFLAALQHHLDIEGARGTVVVGQALELHRLDLGFTC
jgi:hypothetical protein